MFDERNKDLEIFLNLLKNIYHTKLKKVKFKD